MLSYSRVKVEVPVSVGEMDVVAGGVLGQELVCYQCIWLVRRLLLSVDKVPIRVVPDIRPDIRFHWPDIRLAR